MSSTAPKKRFGEELPPDRPPRRHIKKPLTASELYKPSMVTCKIEVSNESIIGATGKLREANFELPRALICYHSKYFETAFYGSFLEKETQTSHLDDVEPWIFRCFVGWLYFHSIFHEEDDEKLSEEAGEQSETSPGPKLGDDFKKPHKWEFDDLFALYIFADQYDIRGFRMAVFDIIELRFLIYQHLPFPIRDEIIHATSNLPATSPLTRLLADFWTNSENISVSKGDKLNTRILDAAKLPLSLLAATFVQARDSISAINCNLCQQGMPCTLGRHSNSDAATRFLDRPCCHYHEHGDNTAERLECEHKWMSWAGYYKFPSRPGNDP